MKALNIKNVRKKFGQLEVLKGIDISLEEGGFLVLLGPSGCGKSTLLSIIAGLEDPTDGEIMIGDQVSNDLAPRDRDIAMVFQSYALYPSMTVRENMAFGLNMRGADKATQVKAVDDAAQMLGIAHLLDRKPADLSGGQRQRVAMGRALVRDPGLFLFDEPLSNLDAKLRVQMRSEIKKLHNRLKTTVVYVTHDQVEAMTLATTIAVMRDGEIQQMAPPEDIYDRPVNLFVAGFVGSPQMNFLHGNLRKTAHDYAVVLEQSGSHGDVVIPLPKDAFSSSNVTDGQPITIGIRPESFRPLSGNTGGFPLTAKTELVEFTGADTLISFTLSGQEVAARLTADFKPALGDIIELTIDQDRIHIFDSESEIRLNE